MRLLIVFFMTSLAFADCDFSQIKEVNGEYVYSEELHICVGNIVEENELRKQQVDSLKKAIELKDLAARIDFDRLKNYEQVAIKNTQRLNDIADASELNNWIYFGLGIAAGFASVYAASQLRRD